MVGVGQDPISSDPHDGARPALYAQMSLQHPILDIPLVPKRTQQEQGNNKGTTMTATTKFTITYVSRAHSERIFYSSDYMLN
jgi:hypothetical protein